MTPAPPRPGHDRILVTGPGKTGTTGLFASIKGGLRAAGIECRSIFEPPNTRKIDNLICLAPDVPFLVKTTLDTQPKSVPQPRIFDRIVMTVRDPRDMVLSSLLFRPLTVAAMERTDESIVEKFIAALEEKQSNPAGTSVQQLFEYADELKIGAPPFASMLKDLDTQQEFLLRYPLYVMQYERFVLGEMSELSEYLGFTVENVASSSSMFGHITRSKGSGEFRQWFTKDDLQYFNEMFHDSLVRFGYDLDVELPAEPVIDPSTGSEYVRRSYAERTKNRGGMVQARTDAWSVTDVTTVESLQHLIDFGTDGDAMACARVAEVLLSGHLGPDVGGPADALRWARSGAELGGQQAMKLTISLLKEQADGDAATYREARRWKVEMTRRHRNRSPEDKTQIDALQRQVAILRRTAGVSPAKQLMAVIKDPRGDGRKALQWLGGNARAKLARTKLAGTKAARSRKQ